MKTNQPPANDAINWSIVYMIVAILALILAGYVGKSNFTASMVLLSACLLFAVLSFRVSKK